MHSLFWTTTWNVLEHQNTWMHRDVVKPGRLSLCVGREGNIRVCRLLMLWQSWETWESDESVQDGVNFIETSYLKSSHTCDFLKLSSKQLFGNWRVEETQFWTGDFFVKLFFMWMTVMMDEVPPSRPQPVEIDPEFEPLPRPRSCTWPLPRPELIDPASSNTSSPAPSVQQEPGGNSEFIGNLGLLEEDYEEYTEQKTPLPCSEFMCREGNGLHLHHHRHHHGPHLQQLQSPQLPPQQQVPPPGVAPLGGPRKSSSSRRNAWGNMSYADLITKAIDSSPEKRLTLSQIYDWMVKSVPYFKDKGDSNSSAGWKVSVSVGKTVKSRVKLG